MSNRAQRRAQQKGVKTAPVPYAKPTGSGGVVVSYLHPVGEVNARFHNSIVNLLIHDMKGAGHITRHGGRMALSSGANIVTARNKIVRQFLENYPTMPEWLWILDSDMTFEPDTLDRLLAAADPVERPVVGGLCFALMKGEAQEIQPTLYGMSGTTTARWSDYPADQLVQVVATGAACLLVHRTVLERIRDLKWDAEFERKWMLQTGGVPSGRPVGDVIFPPPWPWFQEMVTGTGFGDSMSEDLTFCLRVAQAGFPIYVDTRVKIGHVKPVVIDEEAFRVNKPHAEPPAPTYVVIPVKGKHGYTKSILEQLHNQGGYEQVFVYDNASGTPDTYGYVVPENVTTIPAAGMNIHEMWNAGIKRALAENPRCNIAILNNDIEIGPDFLGELAKGLRLRGDVAAVCGNYDGRQMPEALQAVRGIAAGREDGTGGFAGFAFMVRGEIFAAGCPMFDEQYEIWYGDNDFLLTLDAGDAIYGIVRDAKVVHIDGGSKTAGDGKGKRLTPELAAAAERDRKRFEAKWGAA